MIGARPNNVDLQGGVETVIYSLIKQVNTLFSQVNRFFLHSLLINSMRDIPLC